MLAAAALEDDPSSVNSQHHLAKAQLGLGDWAEAAATVEQAKFRPRCPTRSRRSCPCRSDLDAPPAPGGSCPCRSDLDAPPAPGASSPCRQPWLEKMVCGRGLLAASLPVGKQRLRAGALHRGGAGWRRGHDRPSSAAIDRRPGGGRSGCSSSACCSAVGAGAASGQSW